MEIVQSRAGRELQHVTLLRVRAALTDISRPHRINVMFDPSALQRARASKDPEANRG